MSSKLNIDINCDVGEGVGNEAVLMPYISSCNIACGAHAGDIETIDTVLSLAKEHKIKVGAHPAFPDRENFGRKVMQISPQDLKESILNQIELLQIRARLQELTLHHIKPHGALYNLAAVDKNTAVVVVAAIKEKAPNTFLYVPYGSVIADIALAEGIAIKHEAFADRNYNEDLTLVSRTQDNALLTNREAILEHVYHMVVHQKVKTITGRKVPIQADTFCVHGDNEKAIEIVAYLHDQLQQKGITIA